MCVHCDVCNRPGSPNEDAGCSKAGGWLCAAHRQIEFTPEEKRKLAQAISKAGRHRWDVLLEISTRIGCAWEPVDTCVADIADYWASSMTILQRLSFSIRSQSPNIWPTRRTGRNT